VEVRVAAGAGDDVGQRLVRLEADQQCPSARLDALPTPLTQSAHRQREQTNGEETQPGYSSAKRDLFNRQSKPPHSLGGAVGNKFA